MSRRVKHGAYASAAALWTAFEVLWALRSTCRARKVSQGHRNVISAIFFVIPFKKD